MDVCLEWAEPVLAADGINQLLAGCGEHRFRPRC
jgi:hypothetical protein